MGKEKNEKQKANIQKINNKMIDLNPNISINT